LPRGTGASSTVTRCGSPLPRQRVAERRPLRDRWERDDIPRSVNGLVVDREQHVAGPDPGGEGRAPRGQLCRDNTLRLGNPEDPVLDFVPGRPRVHVGEAERQQDGDDGDAEQGPANDGPAVRPEPAKPPRRTGLLALVHLQRASGDTTPRVFTLQSPYQSFGPRLAQN
jgi:hypothetical protein